MDKVIESFPFVTLTVWRICNAGYKPKQLCENLFLTGINFKRLEWGEFGD